jgi:hypothetical protein
MLADAINPRKANNDRLTEPDLFMADSAQPD